MAKSFIKKDHLSKNYYCMSSDKEKVYDKRKPEGPTLDINDIGTKILIYEDRVNGWFLDIARQLNAIADTGFVILSIAISYIEGNQQYREGCSSKNQSGQFFTRGMLRIFDGLDESISSEIYKQVRCGLFHDGMTQR